MSDEECNCEQALELKAEVERVKAENAHLRRSLSDISKEAFSFKLKVSDVVEAITCKVRAGLFRG